MTMTRETPKATIRKFFLLALLAVLVAAGLLGAAACYLGIKTRMDLTAYAGMIHDRFNPLWRDLALRRIGKGDRLDALVAKHTPLRREDFPPFVLLHYQEPFGSLTVVAKDGRLVQAGAGSCTWHHTFFETSEMNPELDKAYLAYVQQRRLEIGMYRIHLAMVSGQTVFLAHVIGPFPVSATMFRPGDAMRKLPVPMIEVEVTQVVCGTITKGTKLQIPTTQLGQDDLREIEVVFLHVEDSRILYPHESRSEMYTTVSRKALDKYLTLTAEQVHEMEVRRLSQSPDLAKCVRLKPNEVKSPPTPAGESSAPAAGLGTAEK